MTAHSALILAVIAAPGGLVGFLGSQQGQLIFYGVIMIAFMYFIILRPQQRRAREHAARTGSIKRGDQVVLVSGVIGKVVRVEDAEIGVEIAQNVTVKVVKSMIAEVRARGEPAAANDAKS
ncbi:MAG: preprotein translocase subunit YajC [Caulobacteraceae bacterium]